MTNAQREGELSTAQWLLLGALVLALLVLSAWGVYATLTGVNSILIWDFHPPWTALRAMLREGADPYGPEVLGTIQEQMLGRAALPGEDQCAFAYPLYIMILIGPLVYLPLPLAQAIWLALILASLFVFALLAPRAIGWHPPTWLLVLMLLFTPGLYSTVWAVWLGQVSIVAAAVTAVAWWGGAYEALGAGRGVPCPVHHQTADGFSPCSCCSAVGILPAALAAGHCLCDCVCSTHSDAHALAARLAFGLVECYAALRRIQHL